MLDVSNLYEYFQFFFGQFWNTTLIEVLKVISVY